MPRSKAPLKPNEHPKWGSKIDTPCCVAEMMESSLIVDTYANARHVVTLHLTGAIDIVSQSAFYNLLLAKVPGATAQTLEDGTLIAKMSERDFCEKLDGKVLHHASGLIL